MTTDQNLMPYAKLAGFGLVVVANRFRLRQRFLSRTS